MEAGDAKKTSPVQDDAAAWPLGRGGRGLEDWAEAGWQKLASQRKRGAKARGRDGLSVSESSLNQIGRPSAPVASIQLYLSEGTTIQSSEPKDGGVCAEAGRHVEVRAAGGRGDRAVSPGELDKLQSLTDEQQVPVLFALVSYRVELGLLPLSSA